MHISLTRRQLLALAAAQAAVATVAMPAWASEPGKPLLRRIKMATLGAVDLGAVEDLYAKWLGYRVVERGNIAPELANSWGAPASAGRRYICLQPASGVDVFVRAVEIDPVPGYKPMTTLGWNAVELIVEDVYKLYETLKGSPYEIIGEPHSLGGDFASIHALQLIGPANEAVYLTCETGDRTRSPLPIPQSFVDRPFIMVLGTKNVETVENYYGSNFNLPNIGRFSMPIPVIARAQGVPEDHIFPMSLLMCAERGHSIEVDGYAIDAGARPRAEGQLPPGVAITSFSVQSLKDLAVPFIANPAPLYDGKHAATFVGTATELVELIEDPI